MYGKWYFLINIHAMHTYAHSMCVEVDNIFYIVFTIAVNIFIAVVLFKENYSHYC